MAASRNLSQVQTKGMCRFHLSVEALPQTQD